MDARIVLAEEAVSIARYTEQVLDNADAECGVDFAQNARDKIVSREANVRGSANRVALGARRAPQGLEEAPQLARSSLRFSEDDHRPTTPGNKCAKYRSASLRKDCSLSTTPEAAGTGLGSGPPSPIGA